MRRAIIDVRWLALALLLVLPSYAAAASYYVDCASAGGNGTTTALSGANAAWATIAGPNGKVFSAGDSLLLKRGCSWTSSRLIMDESGSAGNPITIGAYGTGTDPLIDASGAQNYAIYTAAATYVTIENMRVAGATSYNIRSDGDHLILTNVVSTGGVAGIRWQAASSSSMTSVSVSGTTSAATGYGIYMPAAASTITLASVSITNCTAQYGLLAWNTTGLTITDLTLTGSSSYGANFDLNTTLVITRATISGNGNTGAVFTNTSGATLSNLTVSGNLAGGNGLTFATANSNVIVQDSTVYSNKGDGVSFAGTGAGNIVRRTIAYSNGDAAISASGDGFTSHDSVGIEFQYCLGWGNFKSGVAAVGTSIGAVKNCTFYSNYEASQVGNWGVYISSTGAWTVQNVVTWNHEFEFYFATGSSVTSDYNVAWDSRGGSAFYWLGTAYNWAGYLAASGQEAHSIHADPLLGADYRPRPGSPALGAGVDLSLTPDLRGDTVAAPVTIGAYQLAGGCVLPIHVGPRQDFIRFYPAGCTGYEL